MDFLQTERLAVPSNAVDPCSLPTTTKYGTNVAHLETKDARLATAYIRCAVNFKQDLTELNESKRLSRPPRCISNGVLAPFYWVE